MCFNNVSVWSISEQHIYILHGIYIFIYMKYTYTWKENIYFSLPIGLNKSTHLSLEESRELDNYMAIQNSDP